MAITSSYPIAAPTANDTLVGTKFIEKKEPATSSFNIGDLANFIAGYITVSPINLGVANGLSLTGTTLSLGLASGSANGALSSANWTTFNNKQNALSGTGIVKCAGSTVSYITDGSVNWNTAYNDSITAIAVTGTTTKTLTLTQQDGGTLSASWANGSGGTIGIGSPANGLSIVSDLLYIALANSVTTGALSSTDWTIFNNKQAALSFSAPLINTSNTVSIPAASTSVNGYLTSANWNTFNNKQNALSGTGFIKADGTVISYDNSTYTPTARTLSINGTVQDLGANRSWTIPTHDPVTIGSPANGLSLSTQALSLALSSSTTVGALSAADWNTFNNKQNSLNGTGFIKASGTTISYDNNTYALDSDVVKLTGAQTIAGDKTFSNNIDVTGSVTAAAGFFNSDIRLKKLVDYDYNIATLEPINYIWKDGRDTKKHVGYSAQEVQNVMPYAISEGENGILSVNYIEVLVAKVALMEAEIKFLKSNM